MNALMLSYSQRMAHSMAKRTMVTVCCVCHEILKIQEGRGVSHGYCKKHFEEAIEEAGK